MRENERENVYITSGARNRFRRFFLITEGIAMACWVKYDLLLDHIEQVEHKER